MNEVEHIIKTATRISHRPTVQLCLHPKYTAERLIDAHLRSLGIHPGVSFPYSRAVSYTHLDVYKRQG